MIKSPSSISTDFMREIYAPLDPVILTDDASPTKFRRLFDSSRCSSSSAVNDDTADLLCHKTNSSHLLSQIPDSELNNDISKIESSALEKLISTDCSVIILDLRSAYNFSKLHITSAKLANCSSKMKSRRAIQIVSEILKTSFDLHRIVLYTEYGMPFKQDDPITILIQFLISRDISCLYLTGNLFYCSNFRREIDFWISDSFKKFETIYPGLCESGSSNVLCLHIPKSVPDFTDIYFTKASLILPFLYLGGRLSIISIELGGVD